MSELRWRRSGFARRKPETVRRRSRQRRGLNSRRTSSGVYRANGIPTRGFRSCALEVDLEPARVVPAVHAREFLDLRLLAVVARRALDEPTKQRAQPPRRRIGDRDGTV